MKLLMLVTFCGVSFLSASCLKAQDIGSIIGAFRNGNIIVHSGGFNAGGFPAFGYNQGYAANANIIRHSGGIDPLSAVGAFGTSGYGNYRSGARVRSFVPTPRVYYGNPYTSPYGNAYSGSHSPTSQGLPGEFLYEQLGYRDGQGGYVRPNPQTNYPTPAPPAPPIPVR